MNKKSNASPCWSLWLGRLFFTLALIFITQQMLTDTPIALSFSVWDKLLHFGVWGLMVGVGYYVNQSRRVFTYLSLAIFTYSPMLEILQPLVSQRSFSIGDIIGNALGCLFAYWLVPKASKLLRRFFRRHGNRTN